MYSDTLSIAQRDPIGTQSWSGASRVHEPFLGPMPTLARVDPYEGRNVQFWTLPENYKGRNLYLKDTIRDLMFTEEDSFMFKYISPPYPTNEINVMWTEFEAKAHLLDITPPTTRSHQIAQSRTIRRAQLFRWGIEAEFESDFLKTAFGRVSFLAALRQIANSVKETFHQQAIRALTLCHRQQNQFLKETSQPSLNEFERFLRTDKERFGMVNKTKNALEKLDLLINKEMQMYGGVADAYLIPEEIAIHTTIVPPEKTDYYLAGDMGPNRVNAVPAGRLSFAGNTQGTLERAEPMHMVRNVPAYVVKNRAIQGASETDVQNLTRVRQIGEYTTMIDDCPDYREYKTEHRSILMFDHDINDMKKISLKTVIEKLEIWDGDAGNVKGPALRRRHNDTYREDQDEDFLTVVLDAGTTRQRGAVVCIGDIDPVFLPTDKVLDGGITICNTILKNVAFDNVFRVANGVTEFRDGVRDKLKKAFQTVIPEIEDALLNEIIAYVLDLRAVTVERDNVPTTRVTPVDPINSRIGAAFIELLEGQVPATKRGEIKEITTNDRLSVMEKATGIRDKMIEYVGLGIAGTTKLKTKEHVEQWFDTRVKQYEKQIQEAQSSRSAETQQLGGEILFVPRGTNLSGTQYKAVENIGTMTGSRGGLSKTLSSAGRLTARLGGIAASSADWCVKLGAALYLLIPMTKQSMLGLCDLNIMVPMNFLLFRPHMQFATRAIIKCKQNGGSMYTFMGNEDFQIAHEAGRKMAMMHFTLYFRCVVHDARNVYVQPDVYIQEREGGCGTRFWTVNEYSNNYNPENLIASLFAICVPIAETNFPNPLSATGRWESEYSQGIQNLRNLQPRLHYSTAKRFAGENMYKWDKDARTGLNVPHLMRGRTHRNLIMYQGHQQNYNIKRGDHSRITPNKGHLSKNIYAGCADIFNGALDVLEEQDYATKNSN